MEIEAGTEIRNRKKWRSDFRVRKWREGASDSDSRGEEKAVFLLTSTGGSEVAGAGIATASCPV